jgi:hypothetical protein
MRAHHAIAVVVVFLVGLGLKLSLFSAPSAEAETGSIENFRVDVFNMQRNVQTLPVEKSYDMTFVYSGAD